jgi:hypothetical protein
MRWTLTNGQVASVADLCAVHSAPLDEIVQAAGLNPPANTEEATWAPPAAQRQPRKRSFEPLAWTPPPS